MATTTTDFNQPPYHDDYVDSKNFHRILFVPKTSVQARELTQLQTILQEQIRRHGNYMFKDGTIIDGCDINYIPKFDFVRLVDYCDIYDANTASFATQQLFDVNIVANTIVEASNGLRAQVQAVGPGSIDQYPTTNRVYVKYLNSVSNGSLKTFSSNQQLTFYAQPRSANVIVARANTITSNVTANTIGAGYGIQVGEGLIYQKGFFVRVANQAVIVNNFSTDVGNTYVGFRTDELIITPDLDESLNDNALGYGNENAPGAHRLKLVPTLYAVDFDTADTLKDFTPIVTFIYGVPVQKGTDAELNRLGDTLAKQREEESGSYYVKPFLVDTRDHPSNTDLLQVSVGAGIAYVAGRRVELVKTAFLDIDRGSSVNELEGQIITGSFGNYVLVNDLAGIFEHEQMNSVTFYNAEQNALTNRSFAGLSPTGTAIATARVRAVRYVSGTPGTPSAIYALHLTDIKVNSGRSFANAVSVFQSATGAAADMVTNGAIYETTSDSLIFQFGAQALKQLTTSTGNNNTQYTVRATTDATLATNGSITLSIPTSHGGGSDVLPYGTGNIGDTNENDFIIVTQSAGQTANLSGTVVANTSTPNLIGTSTTFNTNFSAGEYVGINHGAGTDIRRIVSVTNATHLVLDAAPSTGNNTGAKVTKYFPNGYIIPLGSTLVGTRTANVISNTQVIISVGLDAAASLASSIPVKVHHNILRQNATAIPKTILKRRFVRINPNTNAGGLRGPWSLGVPDVHKIRAVYVGTGTYATTNPNRTTKFYFDPGQRLTHYEHAMLYPQSGMSITSSTTLLVELDYFTVDYTSGIGFYSVDSYPIDDANTANVNAITTAEIPQIKASDGRLINLRDCIDFRPRKSITATDTAFAANSTLNPAVTANYNIDSDGTYLISPYENFQADISHYLGRVDVVMLTKEGKVLVKSGTADDNPREPQVPENSMAIATVRIRPYPSLSSIRSGEIATSENGTLVKPNYSIFDTSSVSQITLRGNKRYTMQAIGVLDERIQRLEYYQTLSLLEKSATDMQVPDENGLNRFKNGIFVDPFTSHENGEVSNPEYKIAIDDEKGEARPIFEKTVFDLEYVSGSNVTRKESLITLPYTHRLQFQQKLASKYRLCAPVARSWQGKVTLHPGYSFRQDEKRLPAKNVTIDLTGPWEEFANSPFGQKWGDWKTSSKKSTVFTDWKFANGAAFQVGAGSMGFRDKIETTITSKSRSGQKLTVGEKTSTFKMGDHVVDVSLQPFIAAQVVSFSATGLRPSTRVWPFFEETPVSQYCRPGVVDETKSKDDPDRVRPAGQPGAALITSNTGQLYGRFLIPAGKFRVGDRKFMLVDVDDLVLGGNSTTTSASAVFTAGGISVTKQTETLKTINPDLNVEKAKESVTNTTKKVTQETRHDPIAQTFTVDIGEPDVSGVFATKVDLYFRSRSDSNNGIRVYLTETDNGYPDGNNILPYSDVWKSASAVNVSLNGSVATTFTFDAPVFLSNNKDYALVIKPDGDDPDYLIWTAELGGTDIQTGKQITSQPNPGMFFISANAITWTAIQIEDLKYNLYVAQFSPTSGSVTLSNETEDYLAIDDLTYANTKTIGIGDLIVRCSNVSVVNSTTVNTSVWATVNDITDLIDDKIVAYRGTRNLVANTYYQIHDEPNGNVNAISASTLVGSFKILTIEDREYHAITPRISNIQPAGTSINWEWRGASKSGNTYTLDSAFVPVFNEEIKEFYDKTRVLASRSNEVSNFSNTRTTALRATLRTTNPYISPVIDLTRKNIVTVKNLIDPIADAADYASEYTNDGNIQTKWIGKPVVLADGQDAEDLEVYITAYRPRSSDILVYAKFLAAEDPQTLTDKPWTLLEYQTGGASLYSDTLNLEDFREWKFTLRNSIRVGAPSTCAYSDASNGYVIKYVDSEGAEYNSFKQFQIKIVLMSDVAARVPRLSDIRALALQR